MLYKEEAKMIYKFGEYRWLENLKNGEMSFSCVGNFISIANNTNNIVQGDPLEGVFARQKIGNPQIQIMRSELGSDLEEIPDGDFVFLRRRSAKLKPIFCFFAHSFSNEKFITNPENHLEKIYQYNFDNNMFTGFADGGGKKDLTDPRRFALAGIQSDSLCNSIKEYMKINQLLYNLRYIKYIDFFHGEFFIDPTSEYNELFVKSKEYEYQHEARICLTEESFSEFSERKSLFIGKFDENDFKIYDRPVSAKYTKRWIVDE